MSKHTSVLVICEDLKHFTSFKKTSLDATLYPIKKSKQTRNTLQIEYLDGETVSCTAYTPKMSVDNLKGAKYNEALQLSYMSEIERMAIEMICHIDNWIDLS